MTSRAEGQEGPGGNGLFLTPSELKGHLGHKQSGGLEVKQRKAELLNTEKAVVDGADGCGWKRRSHLSRI